MLNAKEQKWLDSRLARISDWQTKSSYQDFINDEKISGLIDQSSQVSTSKVKEIIAKAKENAFTGQMLAPAEVATLINVKDPELWGEIFDTADWIKKQVYGNRIVLFAPLYLSNACVNNCAYCGFRKANDCLERSVLDVDEVLRESLALIDQGHKRLIAVYGEHPDSDAEYICNTVEQIYAARKPKAEIRRCNINAAPMFVDEYERIRDVGIGTYQIFQETYHKKTYKKIHPAGTLKGNYNWRLFGLHRALEAGIDDVALGVLFGLYDWRFELLGLLYHAMSLEKEFGIGPHTISYPRIVPAENAPLTTKSKYLVSDEDFLKIVAIIRLMCPYTGSICTAREPFELRLEAIKKGGVSQMDAGTRIGVGGYSQMQKEHLLHKEQFMINDTQSLDAFISSLCKEGYLPSFCTAGYREGRTGANFMPLAKSASVKNFCIANGILTFKEYLMDYASDEVKKIGEQTILPRYTKWIQNNVPQLAGAVQENLQKAGNEIRDLHF